MHEGTHTSYVMVIVLAWKSLCVDFVPLHRHIKTACLTLKKTEQGSGTFPFLVAVSPDACQLLDYYGIDLLPACRDSNLAVD